MVAVHLRGGGDEHALVEAVAAIENGLRALDVRDERVHRALDDQLDAHSRREVEDDVALVDELVQDRGGENGVDDEMEVPAFLQMSDVPHRRRREVIQRVDLPALVEQALAQMRADESRAPGDERLAPPFTARCPLGARTVGCARRPVLAVQGRAHVFASVVRPVSGCAAIERAAFR
jgi:hypothetical protein